MVSLQFRKNCQKKKVYTFYKRFSCEQQRNNKLKVLILYATHVYFRINYDMFGRLGVLNSVVKFFMQCP